MTFKKITAAMMGVGILCFGFATSQAQTTANYIGPVSGGEWNTPANWDTGAPPADSTTNAVIGAGTNVSYNLPMVASSFGTLALNGILNVNTNGFNSGAVTLLHAGGGNKLFLNFGAIMNVAGNLAFCSNSVVVVSNGASLNVNGSLLIGCGASGTTGSGTPGSFGIMTNFGGTISANTTTLNAPNGSVTAGALLVINGGTNNLGNLSIKRSAAGSGGFSTLGTEGVIIYGGQVMMTNVNVGGTGGNSFLTLYIAGGTVTNMGSAVINQGSSARGSRILQTGGLFVVPDPGVVNPNPTVSGSLNIYSILGGTNIIGGLFLGNSNGTAGTVNFTNSTVMYVGSQGIAGNGVATINAVLNSGGLIGATAPWTGSVPMKLSGGTFTFQTADMNNNPNNIVLSGPLNGAGGLNVSGSGILTLGTANTYSGNTTISGGTLALGLGASVTSSKITLGTGTTFDVTQVAGFNLGGAQTLAGSGTVAGAVTAPSGATIFPGSNTVTGTLTFTGGLTENGGVNNQFTLSGSPTGPGNDFINVSGGLNLTGTNNILITGSLATGGAYPLFGYNGSLTGDITNLAVSGASGIFSNSAVTKIIYFIAQSSIRGATNVVWVGNPTVNNWDTEVTTNWLNKSTSALDFFVPGDTTFFSDVGASNPVVNIPGIVAPSAVIVNTTSNYTFTGNGVIGGVGGLTVSNGVLNVQTTNTYTGQTVFAGGTLVTANIGNSSTPSGLGDASADPGNLIFNGGALAYTGASTSTDHGMTFTNGGGTFDVINGTTLTLSGLLNGNGSLTLVDSGAITLASANNYSGGTIISNGTVTLNTPTAAGTGTITLAGGNLNLTTSGQTTYNNNLTVTANSTLTSAGGNNNIIGGAISGGANVTLNVAINGTGTFTLGAQTAGSGSLTNFFGTIELGNDSGFFRFNSGGGNFQFGGPNTTFDLGSNNVVLEARNPGTMVLGALEGGPSTVVKGPSSTAGALEWQIGSSTSNPNSTFFGIIADNSGNESSSLTKVGTGTLTLESDNGYSGATTVSSGTLALAGNGGFDNSPTINIASGAILDASQRFDSTLSIGVNFTTQILEGGGTINGALSVGSFGTLAPGGAQNGNTGTLRATNNIILNGVTWMKLNRGNTPNCDQVISTLSNVSYGGALIITNIGAPLQVGDTFQLFGGASAPAGSFNNILVPNYVGLDLSQLGVNGTITVTNVSVPRFSSIDFSGLSGGSVVLNATNGLPGGPATVLTSTNLALPLSSWTVNSSTAFDGNGDITGFTITVNPAAPQQFITLKAQ